MLTLGLGSSSVLSLGLLKYDSQVTFDLDGHNYPPSPASSTLLPSRKYALATELVFTEHNDQYNSSSVPIYQVASSSD